MRIAIVAPSSVPFTIGGAEKLWWGMLDYLNNYTEHQAELIKLPSPEGEFQDLIQSYKMFSELDLSHFDCVISTKYPAWMIEHPNHICYLQHKLRGLYDTYHFTGLPEKLIVDDYPESYRRLLDFLGQKPDRKNLSIFFQEVNQLCLREDSREFLKFPGPLSRAIVHYLDSIAQLPEAINKYVAISQTVASRTNYFPEDVDVEVTHHPSDLKFYKHGEGRHIFTISRLDKPKRLDLLVRAYRKTNTTVPLLIAGTGPEEQRLKNLAAGDERIKFLGRITDQEVIDYYADALFIPFLPYDEDFGLITIEAMKSGKAVLTTNDSGGALEFVKHLENGWIALPTVEGIEEGLNALLLDTSNTLKMGQRAMSFVEDITWENVFKTLFVQKKTEQKTRRLNCVVVSSFEVFPPRSGGQARIYNLYKQLSKLHNVTIVSLGNKTETKKIANNFTEIVIKYSDEQVAYEHAFKANIDAEVGDIASINGCLRNHEFLIALQCEVKTADVVFASHPYSYRAIKEVWRGPLIYDSHNVELDMKKAVLGNQQCSNDLLIEVEAVERECVESSQLILCCSQQDQHRFMELYSQSNASYVVVPNGVDTASVKYVSQKVRQANRKRMGLPDKERPILYMGSWHEPNILAAKAVVKMAKLRPDLTFWFMGSMCRHPDLRQLPSNIMSLGVLTTDEKTIVMESAAIALNPIERGSGTNLKLLDYIASGIPTITTKFGNRGFNFINNQEVIVCELTYFAKAVDLLLGMSDDELDHFTFKAKEKVVDQFDWSASVESLTSALAKTVH